MTITTCPHCQLRVLPRPDGTCPSCNGLIAQTESSQPSKTSSAVIKRAAKAAGRKKTPAKSAATRAPAASNAKEIEAAYQEYLQTAKDVRVGSLHVFYPYLIAGIILGVVCIILSFFTWDQTLEVFDLTWHPSTATWVFVWLGFAVLLVGIVLGAVKGDQWGNAQGREIAQDRPGFPDFYKAFQKRFWPKEGLPAGPAYNKLLSILGKK
jgi:uncharacterized Zn finger protein (UPF0148 family)